MNQAGFFFANIQVSGHAKPMRFAWILSALLALRLLSPCVAADTLAWFATPFGEMEVALYDQEKPNTVRNFVRLVKAGRYQNNFLHYCKPDSVVQGGGYSVLNPQLFALFKQALLVTNFGSISNEFNVGPLIKNEFGTIAMAKVAGNPHSATSQWFFNLTNNSAVLDKENGGYTVFGKVVRGTEVLEYFRSFALGGGIVDLTLWNGTNAAAFYRLPVQYFGFTPPFYPDLCYVQIRLLAVTLERNSRGEPQISWPSIAGIINYVEYSPALRPPDWRVLKAVTGDGQRLQVTDTAAAGRERYYRVRVDY
jgi:cyclophilin family peptidyl-prolyl cis-trans isomerase